jgi:hypothetical protein
MDAAGPGADGVNGLGPGMMAGMKVTLSAAMRARDVSRPRPEDEEAARESATQPPAGRARPQSTGRAETAKGGSGSGSGSGGRKRKRR